MINLIHKFKRASELGLLYVLDVWFTKVKWHFQRFLGLSKIRCKYGIRLYADYDDATFKFYYFATYSFFYSNYLKNYPEKFVFIDVGANKGLYSILAAKNSSCEKVVSFEPIRSTFDYLKKMYP